jgi:AcrR family transcriptional regulator
MRRILAASAKLFSLNGFDGTTVQQIADEADVAVGTLFLYVSDKSEILLLLFHNAIELQLKKAARRLKAQSEFLPSVRRFLTDLTTPYEKNEDLSKVFWREFLFHKGHVRAELDTLAAAILQVLRERVTAARNAGEVDSSVDADVAALQIYAIYHATLAFYLADCLPGGSPDGTLDSLLHSMWRGMAPRSTTSSRGQAAGGNKRSRSRKKS